MEVLRRRHILLSRVLAWTRFLFALAFTPLVAQRTSAWNPAANQVLKFVPHPQRHLRGGVRLPWKVCLAAMCWCCFGASPFGFAAAAAVPAVSWIASVWLCGYAVLCVMWAQPALRCALCCLCCLWAVASTIIRCGHVANQTVHSDSHIREDRKQKRKMGTGETFGVRKPCRTVFFSRKKWKGRGLRKIALGSVQGIRTALPFTSHGATLGIVKTALSRARSHRGRIPNLEILTCLKSTTPQCVQALYRQNPSTPEHALKMTYFLKESTVSQPCLGLDPEVAQSFQHQIPFRPPVSRASVLNMVPRNLQRHCLNSWPTSL